MKLSVIIPTCNRPGKLQECLRKIKPQLTENHEVIVSDDGAVNPPPDLPHGVRWFPGPRRGPAANRNFGASQASGEWLVFLDDDCLPDDEWLAAYEAAARPDVDVLEGRTECPQPDSFAPYEIIENLTGGAFWSCNFAIRRQLFHELGGFDEDFSQPCAEDLEFAWRFRKRLVGSAFVKRARVIHPARRMTLRSLIKRTAAHRWILLYRLKTGNAPGIHSAALRAIASLIVREHLDTLRMLSHLPRPGGRARIRGNTTQVLWRCLSLTPFLPYYIYWELQYRRKLRQ